MQMRSEATIIKIAQSEQRSQTQTHVSRGEVSQCPGPWGAEGSMDEGLEDRAGSSLTMPGGGSPAARRQTSHSSLPA